MTPRIFRVGVLLPIVFLVVLWSRIPAQANDSEIKIGGGSTALGSMELLAGAFEKTHPGIHFNIFPGVGSTGGFKATAAGAADIGLMGRPLTEKERAASVVSMEYARTPLAFIAQKDVPVSGVTNEELVKIYEGKTTTWPGGERIRLILYTADDPDTLLEKQISPTMSKAVDDALARHGMIVAMSTQEGYDKVRQIPGALGFCSLTKVMTEKGSVKVLSYNGVQPGVQTLKKKTYPLFKPLYMVVSSNPSRPVREFLDFVASSQGEHILEQAGDMPVPFKLPR